MCNAAATSRRRIWHDGNRRTLKKRRQLILGNVASKLNCRVPRVFSPYGFHVACSLRMVTPADHESGVGQSLRHNSKGLNHELQPFVSPPFAESENAMFGVSAHGKVRIFRSCDQSAVGAQMHVVAAIFFMQDLSITGHQYRDRVRQQQHSGGDGAGEAVGTWIPHSRILQVHGIHQVMQSNVGVVSAHASEHRCK
jgi:hypothetical protein